MAVQEGAYMVIFILKNLKTSGACDLDDALLIQMYATLLIDRVPVEEQRNGGKL